MKQPSRYIGTKRNESEQSGDLRSENLVQCGNLLAWEFHENAQRFNLLIQLFSHEIQNV